MVKPGILRAIGIIIFLFLGWYMPVSAQPESWYISQIADLIGGRPKWLSRMDESILSQVPMLLKLKGLRIGSTPSVNVCGMHFKPIRSLGSFL